MTNYFHLTNDCDHSKKNYLLFTARTLADSGIFITHAVHCVMKNDNSLLCRHTNSDDTQCLSDASYLSVIKEMNEMGHEICYHGFSQSHDTREEFIQGLEMFTDKLNFQPRYYIEHGGHALFNQIEMVKAENLSHYGLSKKSKYYIGDLLKNFDAITTNAHLKDRLIEMPLNNFEQKYGTKLFYRSRNINIVNEFKESKNIIGYTHFGYQGYYPQKHKLLKYFVPHRAAEMWGTKADIVKAVSFINRLMEKYDYKSTSLADFLVE